MRYFDLLMTVRLLLWLAFAACSSPLNAQIALNPYTGRYEIAPHSDGLSVSPIVLQCMSPVLAVRPEGANHQWRRNPPGELSIDPVADERLMRVTAWVGAS